MTPDRRIPPCLGRMLDGDDPAGTCFQVAPGVLVTAWHVLEALGAEDEGAVVRVDPLAGGLARQARVACIDPPRDLAVLVTEEPLPGCVPGLAASDEVELNVPVVITGVSVLDDPDHLHRYLNAAGHWAGASLKDQIRVGRVEASGATRGMSGAPVMTLFPGRRRQAVVGIVSARYNSQDGWGRDSVWVTRTEDLAPLLAGLADVTWLRASARPRRAGQAVMVAVTACALLLAVLFALMPRLLGGIHPGSHGSSAIIARVYSGGRYGFSAPNRIAADSTHVWVTNPPGNSVTELNASDGSLVRVLADASYSFDSPVGIADDGTHVWVANTNGNSVTELNASDGSLVRTLAGANYGFAGPVGIADDGTHVWVANTNGNSVTELNASDGSLVRTLAGASYSFNRPYEIALDRTHAWVVNTNGNLVTELNASNGRLVRTLAAASYSFSYPAGIADDGTHVWVANAGGNSVIELNASNGSLIRTLTRGSYNFSSPREITLAGAHVWVANADNDSVTELNASNGSLVKSLTGASYGFNGPWGITAAGKHVWLTNAGGNSVTELTAS